MCVWGGGGGGVLGCWNHQVDSPFNMCPDVCSGDLQALKRLLLYMTSSVLTETRCP